MKSTSFGWIAAVALLVHSSVSAFAHTSSPLDEYGCHSNTALYGSSSKRECHVGLLAGQVFSSTTAEYKAYIAAQKVLLAAKDATITSLTTQLATCNVNCPVAPTVGSLTLSWSANAEPDLAGYRAYCGTASKTYSLAKSLGKVTTVQIGNLPTGKTYYCAVTAFDNMNNESAFSAEINKAVP